MATEDYGRRTWALAESRQAWDVGGLQWEDVMADIVVAHGAWSAGWAWKKMRPLMAAQGHTLWTPTYTGVGDRSHLAGPRIDLDTHIEDVVQLLEFEDLRDVVLVGHSYGGMVATGVADKARERLVRLIYLDAFVPRDGQSLGSLMGLDSAAVAAWRSGAGDGWRVPPRAMPPDTPEADRAWATPRRMPQPIETLLTPVRLARGETDLPRAYIYCTRPDPADGFRRFYERALSEAGWTAHEIDASHNPHITAAEALARLLAEIIGPG
jgi:pimeloyl-ACP methyl ester carboxylesterase